MTVLILPYECTNWTLTKRVEKKLEENYTRVLRAILNEPWKEHPIKQQLYDHYLLFQKLSKVNKTCAARAEFIDNFLLWIPTQGRARVWLTSMDLYQLRVNTGYSLENMPEMIDERDGWWERKSGNSELSARFNDDDDHIYQPLRSSRI